MNLRLGPTVGALVACLGAASVVGACDGSNTESDVPPLTGIRIDTLGLFGVDSCGNGPNQIAKIAVALETIPITDASTAPADATDADPEPVEAGPRPADGYPLTTVSQSAVFDCFAEASFLARVPVFATYKLRVFGYSAAGYAPHANTIPTSLRAPADDAVLAAPALAVASCTATQQPNVRATAVCVLDRDSRALGAADAGGDASVDGGLDASDEDASDAASDAGDASDEDAGDAASDAGDGGD